MWAHVSSFLLFPSCLLCSHLTCVRPREGQELVQSYIMLVAERGSEPRAPKVHCCEVTMQTPRDKRF